MVCVCLLAGACSAASGLAGSPSETTVRGGGREVRISLEDAHQLRGALLQALKNTELQEGPRLLASAQALPAWIDADGRVMISGWLLQFRKGEPALAYRETHDASHATAYSAQIGGKRDGWSVGPIGKESIHLLPR
jgi:hypothetical protein